MCSKISQEGVEKLTKYSKASKVRQGKARAIYSKLKKVWKNSQFTTKNKIRIFKSNVISVLLYGCETWKITQTDEKKQDAFLHKSLCCILKIYWLMRITNGR